MSKNGKSPDLRWSPYARVCPLIYIRSCHQWHPWWPQAPTFSASIAAKNSTAARLDESTTASRFHGGFWERFLKICFFSNCNLINLDLEAPKLSMPKKYSKRCTHQKYCNSKVWYSRIAILEREGWLVNNMENDGSQEGNGVLLWQVAGPIWRQSPYNKKEICGLNIDMLDSKNEFGGPFFGIRSIAQILIQGAQALKGLPSESPSHSWWCDMVVQTWIDANPTHTTFWPRINPHNSRGTQPALAGNNLQPQSWQTV